MTESEERILGPWNWNFYEGFELLIPKLKYGVFCLFQWSPMFLAPETGFMEDSFSTNVGGVGMVSGLIQVN